VTASAVSKRQPSQAFESLTIPAVDRFAVVDGIGSDSPLVPSSLINRAFIYLGGAIHPVMDYIIRHL
jgi:hypothetical protein